MGFVERYKEVLEEIGGESEVVKITKLKQQTVNKWVKVGCDPKMSSLEKLCKGIGISANWLILGVGPKRLKDCVMNNGYRIDDAKKHQINKDILEISEWVDAQGMNGVNVGIAVKVMVQQHFAGFSSWCEKKILQNL